MIRRLRNSLLLLGLLGLAPCAASAQQCIHPCVFLTPAKLTQLQAKAAALDADWLAVRAQADAYLNYTVDPFSMSSSCANGHICYTYEGFGWLIPWQYLGIAYQVTGNVAYAAKGIQIMDAANAVLPVLDPLSNDSGYASRTAAYGLALAFDWFYDQLSSTQKTATITTLNAWFNWMRASAYAKGPAYHNYFGGHLLGFGVAGYATVGDNPSATTMIDWAITSWNSIIAPAFATGGFAGGYEPESYNYGAGHFSRLFQFVAAVKSATGADIPNVPTYARNVARGTIYNVKPNLWQITDEGDWSGNTTGVLYSNFTVLLSDLLAGWVF